MADNTPQVNFNDGEGIDEDDFNRLQSLLDSKIMHKSTRVGSMCNALGMGNATGRGADTTKTDPRSLEQPPSEIYTPDPRAFLYNEISVDGAGDFRIDYGPQLVLQAANSGITPGTPPVGFVGTGPIAYMMDDDELAFSSIARPSANPRFDSINLRIGHAVGNALSRDFEDSSTRALSTTTPDKDQSRLLQQELQQGAESASPVYPTPTSGYGRFITILRETGETSLDRDNVAFHAFPMQLKVETVYGYQGWYAAGFQKSSVRIGSIEKDGAGGAEIVFLSTLMHEGCRLIGIAINTQLFSSLDLDNIKIQRLEGTAAGVFTQVDLLNISSQAAGGQISTSAHGVSFIGLPELDDSDGNDTPIWGNGRSYGPLFSDKAQSPAEGMADDKLVLSLQDSAWAGGENINYVQFFYLE